MATSQRMSTQHCLKDVKQKCSGDGYGFLSHCPRHCAALSMGNAIAVSCSAPHIITAARAGMLYTSPVRSAQKALLGRALRLLGCGWCATGVEMSEALMWSGDLLIAIVRLTCFGMRGLVTTLCFRCHPIRDQGFRSDAKLMVAT